MDDYLKIAKTIDHALLAPTLTTDELEQGCRMAVAYNVASVCILPYYLSRCAELLSKSTVWASTTIGFPHGGQATSVKEAETLRAIADGGEELDMVVNISKVRSGDWQYVQGDIQVVAQVARSAARKLKVIFENCYLDTQQKIRLCEICGELGVDWVKTSTGFGPSGATPEDVRLMREHSPPQVQVKAAGGIRSLDQLLEMQQLGATRIGTSRTKEILDDCRQRLGLEAIAADFTGPSAGY